MYIKKSVYKSYPEIHEEIIQGKFLPKYFESHIYTYKVIDGICKGFEFRILYPSFRDKARLQKYSCNQLKPVYFFFSNQTRQRSSMTEALILFLFTPILMTSAKPFAPISLNNVLTRNKIRFIII